MNSYRYNTCCVNSTAELIGDMLEHSSQMDISRKTFLKYVDKGDLEMLSNGMGYFKHPKQGLTMAGDWHVSYHKSLYEGKRCVYLVHSAIEYIFTKDDNDHS